MTDTEFKQFLSDVMTAAGLVAHGKQSKALAERLGEGVMKLYATPPSVPDFADAYQGAMEEVAIWKKRALEAEALNRKFMAEINGPTHMGEPVATPPSVPERWELVPTELGTELYDACERAVRKGYGWHDLDELMARIDDAYALKPLAAAPKPEDVK